MINKKNIPLIIGLSIPILMIILITASIYMPRYFAPSPKYNFICAVVSGYPYTHEFTVRDEKLIKKDIEKPEKVDTELCLYDAKKNISKSISYNEAKTLKLDSSAVSPDGFEVEHGQRYGGCFPFYCGSYDYNSVYIKGHRISQKLSMKQLNYRNKFYFLGWVIE